MPNTVVVEVNGNTYSGTYTVKGRPPMVYLTSPHGSKATQQGNSPAEAVAKRLLHDLVANFGTPGRS